MPDPTQMTVFALMKSRLQMLGERQKGQATQTEVLAERVRALSDQLAEARRAAEIDERGGGTNTKSSMDS